jgi:hypothetical protein
MEMKDYILHQFQLKFDIQMVYTAIVVIIVPALLLLRFLYRHFTVRQIAMARMNPTE